MLAVEDYIIYIDRRGFLSTGSIKEEANMFATSAICKKKNSLCDGGDDKFQNADHRHTTKLQHAKNELLQSVLFL